MGVRRDSSKNNKWLAEFYLDGKRVRRWFDTKTAATAFFNEGKKGLVEKSAVEPVSRLRLSELINEWYFLHGQYLARGRYIFRRLKAIAVECGDPLAAKFSASLFVEYRAKRLAQINVNTANLELRLLKSVFNTLIRFDKWDVNPLAKLRKLKTKELEVRFLNDDEIERLLFACAEISLDLLMAVKLALSTGARWGEIEGLTADRVLPCKVVFSKTKSGKNRAVPISPELYDELSALLGGGGLVFPDVSRHQFASAVKNAGIKLRDNQSTHVLRHTFASHFMINGGNILVLRDILGHSSVNMTMIYAHFAPDHLETATAFNPLAKSSQINPI